MGSRKLIKKRSTFSKQSKSDAPKAYELSREQLALYRPLVPFSDHFEERQQSYQALVDQLCRAETSLEAFAKQYKSFGVIPPSETQPEYQYNEFAPSALEIYLTGDFNQWNLKEYPLLNDGLGNWSVLLPESIVIPHNSQVAAYVRTAKDVYEFKAPIGAKFVKRMESEKNSFCEIFWNPTEQFVFQNPQPTRPRALKIQVVDLNKTGISQGDSWTHLLQELQSIQDQGFNAVSFVGFQNHKTVGEGVSHPYSINSSIGTPDEFKKLVDQAHGLGLYVIIDAVHTQASSVLSEWDGGDFNFFVGGENARHKRFKEGRVFDFSKWDTQRLLLQTLAYFLEEFKIDGFKFLDLPTILYNHHGSTKPGVEMADYFNEEISLDGFKYLMLANQTIHEINSNAVTLADDPTNFPSICASAAEAGIGFDYRVTSAQPFVNLVIDKFTFPWHYLQPRPEAPREKVIFTFEGNWNKCEDSVLAEGAEQQREQLEINANKRAFDRVMRVLLLTYNTQVTQAFNKYLLRF